MIRLSSLRRNESSNGAARCVAQVFGKNILRLRRNGNGTKRNAAGMASKRNVVKWSEGVSYFFHYSNISSKPNSRYCQAFFLRKHTFLSAGRAEQKITYEPRFGAKEVNRHIIIKLKTKEIKQLE